MRTDLRQTWSSSLMAAMLFWNLSRLQKVEIPSFLFWTRTCSRPPCSSFSSSELSCLQQSKVKWFVDHVDEDDTCLTPQQVYWFLMGVVTCLINQIICKRWPNLEFAYLLKTVCFFSLALILLASSIIRDNFMASHCGETEMQKFNSWTSPQPTALSQRASGFDGLSFSLIW